MSRDALIRSWLLVEFYDPDDAGHARGYLPVLSAVTG